MGSEYKCKQGLDFFYSKLITLRYLIVIPRKCFVYNFFKGVVTPICCIYIFVRGE